MGITITTPSEEQWPDMFAADARGFGITPQPGDMEIRRPIVDLSRFRIALDGNQVVGVSGSYGFDVTRPGGTTVPLGGVTWISVAATHRRRGVLTRMIEACHADIDERGEPVAMLFASEGAIYERFGYGVATQMRGVTIDRAAARLRTDLQPDRDAVRYLDLDDAFGHRERVWQTFRRTRAGELTRDGAWQQFIADLSAKPRGDMTQVYFLAHPDGFAAYRIGAKWTDQGPAHRLEVNEVAALTPQAHLDLWHAVLGVDLVATVGHRALPLDDPLPYLLTDARAVRTTSLNDGLWVNVRDVAVCFGARAYGTADKLVVEDAAGKRWAIEGDGTESSCRAVRTRPDLVVDHASLGALLLGGVRPSQLVAAGRISARSDAAVRRADAFFVTAPVPNCLTFF